VSLRNLGDAISRRRPRIRRCRAAAQTTARGLPWSWSTTRLLPPRGMSLERAIGIEPTTFSLGTHPPTAKPRISHEACCEQPGGGFYHLAACPGPSRNRAVDLSCERLVATAVILQGAAVPPTGSGKKAKDDEHSHRPDHGRIDRCDEADIVESPLMENGTHSSAYTSNLTPPSGLAGQAWITGTHQHMLDATDPYPAATASRIPGRCPGGAPRTEGRHDAAVERECLRAPRCAHDRQRLRAFNAAERRHPAP
jgi:hypothetical protein